MRSLRSLFVRSPQAATSVQDINVLRASCARSSDRELRDTVHRSASSLAQVIAATAVVASRVLGTEIEMHDEQLQASVALAAGQIVEMQTGEGKTLAAVPAVVVLGAVLKGKQKSAKPEGGNADRVGRD